MKKSPDPVERLVAIITRKEAGAVLANVPETDWQTATTPDLLVIGDGRGATILPAVFFPIDDAPGRYHALLAGDVWFEISHDVTDPAGGTHDAKRIKARNRALGLFPPQMQAIDSSGGAALMASALDPISRAIFRPMRESTAHRIDTLRRGAKITTHLERDGYKTTTTYRVVVNLQSSRPLQVTLPLEGVPPAGPIECEQDQLMEGVFEGLAQFNTETMIDMHVLVDLTAEHHTPILAINHDNEAGALVSWAEIGRRKGWDALNKHNRRARLRESIELLTDVKFSFELLDGKGTRFTNMKLFQHTADVERDGQQLGVVISLNPLLWQSMMDHKRAIVYDRAVLKVRLDTGRGDWVFRIYRYLTAQISRGWQTQELAKTGGCWTVQLGTMLDGSGVLYGHYLEKTSTGTRPMGAKALRDQIRKVLADMMAPTWDGRALFTSATLRSSRGHVLNDTVTVQLPEPIAEQLTRLRSRSLASLEATTTKRARALKPRRTRRKATGRS